MAIWLFIGPHPMSGIGQVMLKYSNMCAGSKYITYGANIGDFPMDNVFIFILPVQEFVNYALDMKSKAKNFYVMTICETNPVNTTYGTMLKNFNNILTPSNFCKDIFDKQFGTNMTVLPLYQSPPKTNVIPPVEPYVFYTIGNLSDPRKNIKMLIEAFLRCGFGDNARLLLKATCRDPFQVKLPNIDIINGLISDDDMETLVHNKAHCYINCSHSEGVGMGAVEAALRNKPVIITDFGGLKEYVTTKYTVECTPCSVGANAEFLFTPDMMWGQPKIDNLMAYMKECFDNKITIQEHPETLLKMQEATTFFSRV
jgi:glycosyltransferase involved in cell wall biosynthesis